MLRILIGAAALTVLVSSAAQAQYNGAGNGSSTATGNNAGNPINMNMMPDTRRHVTPEEAAQERDIEMRYNEAKDRIPDKKASNDPWGNLRPAKPSK